MNQQWITVLAVVVTVIALLVILSPQLNKVLGPRMTKMAGEAYQRRFLKQLQKKFPALAARVSDFEMRPQSQEAFQSALKRLPPQEAQKLQLEFNRLRDNLVVRDPELAPLVTAAADAKAQGKAIDAIFKLPDDRRQAIEKDVIWAWDQLRGCFPKLMGTLESAFRKKSSA